MKRTLSLVVAVVMLALCFTGCSSDDIALYKALQNVPQSSVVTEKATFDVKVIEPFSSKYIFVDGTSYDDDMASFNYLQQIYSGLLSIMETETVTTTSGGNSKAVTQVKYPDFVASFTSYTKADGTTAMSIPSYIRPFLPTAIADKQYIVISPQSMAAVFAGMTGFSSDVIGVIGGADGPTAMYITGTEPVMVDPAQLNGLLSNETVIRQLSKYLDVSFVTDVAKSGSDTVYTIKIDSAALENIIKGIVKSLSNEEIAATVGTMSVVMGAAEDAQEVAEAYKEALAGSDEIVDAVCDMITETGMFANGITIKCTVNKDGYVSRTEEIVDMDIDMARIVKATENLIKRIAGEDDATASAHEAKGRVSLRANSVAEVTGINESVDIVFPEFTDKNSIDLYSDITEYQLYSDAKDKWEYGTSHEQYEYMENRQPDETLTLVNSENGKSVTVVPRNFDDYYIYVPVTDLTSLFDEVRAVSWNSQLMGVEIYYTNAFGNEVCDLYLSPEGADVYDNVDEECTDYDKYSFVNSWPSEYEFTDGKFYVNVDFFNWDIDYAGSFADGQYVFHSTASPFEYSKSMDGNLLYEFEKMFE